MAGGVVVGHSGFTASPTNLIAYTLFLATAVGLLISGLRRRSSSPATDPARASPASPG